MREPPDVIRKLVASVWADFKRNRERGTVGDVSEKTKAWIDKWFQEYGRDPDDEEDSL